MRVYHVDFKNKQVSKTEEFDKEGKLLSSVEVKVVPHPAMRHGLYCICEGCVAQMNRIYSHAIACDCVDCKDFRTRMYEDSFMGLF